MKRELRDAFETEMAHARTAYGRGDLDAAFLHLERAHVLGQRFFRPHWVSHWWMLRVGLRRGDSREIAGQVLRLAAVGPLSLVGWVPLGNTGGANVSAVKPMPIPDDLARYFD